MYRVVLGGGIGSGKSTVAAMLEELGAELLDLDEVAAQVREDPCIAARLAERFGSDILDLDGKPIPEILAKKAFADAQSTQDLNAICHPEIAKRARDFISGEGTALMRVVQVPLISLSKDLNEIADEVVLVDCPADIRIQRAIDRGMDPQDAKRRMGRQATDDEQRRLADTLIKNDGSIDELYVRVLSWWNSRVNYEQK